MSASTEHEDRVEAPAHTPHEGKPSWGRRLRSTWPYALFALAAGLWLFWGQGNHSGPVEGEPAPELVVPWTSGEAPFDLAAQRGKVVVLAFWATWCPACRQEGPILSQVQQRIASHGDTVVGVSVDRHPLPAIEGAARRFGMTYPIALATQADSARFRIELLPTVIVVGPDGRVHETFAGTVSEERLIEAVEDARQGG
jgi:thiol-disulfide isomerase/thioredoxin